MTVCTIDRATLDDMQFFLALAKNEGWNPGLCDAKPFNSTDPNGFFIERLDDRPIGCISAVAFNDSYGFMGLYIVAPEFRGKDYGIALWKHAITYLGNRTIGLDGVVAQQENYKKSGFQFYYNNIRFEGKLKGKSNEDLVPISAVPIEALLEYDTAVCGFNRFKFLQHWVVMPNSYGFAKVVDGKVNCYGVIRKCETGYKIGPLFADNFDVANQIFLTLVEKCDGGVFVIDIAEPNKEGLNLVTEHHLVKTFETARMYKGPPPKQELSKIFGVTCLELG
jgi:GNAT superfamily N-acetyltransferase